jgi:hypothetical protein
LRKSGVRDKYEERERNKVEKLKIITGEEVCLQNELN